MLTLCVEKGKVLSGGNQDPRSRYIQTPRWVTEMDNPYSVMCKCETLHWTLQSWNNQTYSRLLQLFEQDDPGIIPPEMPDQNTPIFRCLATHLSTWTDGHHLVLEVLWYKFVTLNLVLTRIALPEISCFGRGIPRLQIYKSLPQTNLFCLYLNQQHENDWAPDLN